MKALAYALLAIALLMAAYCTLVRPGADNLWYLALMFGIAALGGLLHGLARRRQQHGE